MIKRRDDMFVGSFITSAFSLNGAAMTKAATLIVNNADNLSKDLSTQITEPIVNGMIDGIMMFFFAVPKQWWIALGVIWIVRMIWRRRD
jgi:hypothetical protein